MKTKFVKITKKNCSVLLNSTVSINESNAYFQSYKRSEYQVWIHFKSTYCFFNDKFMQHKIVLQNEPL